MTILEAINTVIEELSKMRIPMKEREIFQTISQSIEMLQACSKAIEENDAKKPEENQELESTDNIVEITPVEE